ncbi:PREDICTED: uncharacterized protein LOC109353750 isoform X2 [Lupinus angustifolius]|uniref:uncharacterized protein LOC109353750 isoform X2 n=1 Tax=Lupinus angustifolius TaxID=3871 RepID=UPI00092E6AA6|nr:PREDICTED: uncharacterized protein LOC109353750 isoform X2 [Lupinus angustifolius]
MFGSAGSKDGSKVSSNQGGKTVFSEDEALKHFNALTEVTSKPVNSQADLTPALEYVLKESQNTKETADVDVDVEVNLVPENSSDSNMKNLVLSMLPKGVSDAKDNTVLVSTDIDVAPSKEGNGDKLSSAAFMMELARGVSKSAQELKNGVIFFFNTAEEGAKRFITQKQWGDAIRVAIDLNSLFTEGKKPNVFQGVVPPGAIKSSTEFLGKLSGKDFPFTNKKDQPQVPHTKNYKFEPEKQGSFQHLGDNLLPFLLDHMVGSGAGKRFFSGVEALKHLNALTNKLSPPVDSKADDLNPSLQYVLKEIQKIKESADRDVNVEVDRFPINSGDLNLKNVVLRILPKAVSDAKANAALVSAHVDAASKKENRDKLSSVAFMLELARGVSKNAQELKNGVIFLFNTAEEHAKSFITQHQLSDAIRVAIDLDSLFAEGKKPSVFQGLIPPQGIKSALDLLGKSTGSSAPNPSGKGFLFIDKEDRPQMPHTRNHKFDPEKPESFQHLGDNLLPFLLQLDHAVGPAASKGSSAAGKTVFSGADALKHAKALTEMLSRPVDSKADLNPAQQYVLKELQKIKGTAKGDVDVDVNIFPVKSGDSNMKNVVLRILPKAVSDAKEKAILVSANTDATAAASKEAARDKLSSAAFMLELALGVSKSARELENGVIFLFNSAKEDAKSFIIQKNTSDTISEVIDLDSLFAEGEKPIVYQDLSSSGPIKSSTSAETGVLSSGKGPSGDKQGTFQDMGDNLLSYLLHNDH